MGATLRQLLSLTAVAFAFMATAGVAGQFDWGRGRERAVLLLLGLLSLPWLQRRGRRPTRTMSRRVATVLAVSCALLFANVTAFFFHRTDHEPVDIAITTLAAVRVVADGRNPYLEEIDPHPELLPERWREFAGFKYLPVMAAAYLPLGLPWGLQGLYATNYLLHGLIVVLVGLLGARLGSPGTGLFAGVLYLLVPFAPFELFRQGVTDLAALVPLLLALCLVDRRPLTTGVLVGLSISTKLLPGALFVVVCLPRERRLEYAVGGAIGLLPAALFLAASPQAFIDNLLVFNTLRPTDSTSWLHWAPANARALASGVLASGLLASGAWVWRRRPDLLERIALANACILATLILGPICHRNYLLWWLPLMALLVARAALVEPLTREETKWSA